LSELLCAVRTPEFSEEHGLPPGTYISAFARGLSVIRAFGPHAPEMTLSQVAERTGLTRANARRVLLTLLHLGYVVQRERHFRLTARILDLGYAYLSSQSLASIAQPVMEELATRVHERCNVAVLDGDEIIYIARVATKGTSDAYPMVNIGRRFPAIATSMGRVLLAALPDAELDRFLKATSVPKYTINTTTDPQALKTMILQVREKGWAFVRQEHSDISSAIGVPLRGSSGNVIAALGIGWFPRTAALDSARCDELLPPVLEAAGEINRAMRLGQYDSAGFS
jgi:IclR family transcriptional regulator, pca regulon regulatory protein